SESLRPNRAAISPTVVGPQVFSARRTSSRRPVSPSIEAPAYAAAKSALSSLAIIFSGEPPPALTRVRRARLAASSAARHLGHDALDRIRREQIRQILFAKHVLGHAAVHRDST